MPANQVVCSHCGSFNRPDAGHCRGCGRALESLPDPSPEGLNVLLQKVMGGEVYTALYGEEGTRKTSGPTTAPPPPPGSAAPPAPAPESDLPDYSDVIGAAVDRIRAKAQEQDHRFKPYVRSKTRAATTPAAKDEAATHLDVGVALLRERRFEEAIEPLLKAIARDDEDRRAWILLAEAYLRIERPYKAAVAYLRSLELNPRDEQAWLGLGRVLRSIDELPTAATVLERATTIHPEHADSWAERGLILAAMHILPEAAQSFKKALELRPDHRIAFAKRAEVEASMREASLTEATSAPSRSNSLAVDPVTVADPTDMIQEVDTSLGREEPETLAASPAPEEHPQAAPETLAEHPNRIRTFVEGLDEGLEGGIPWGHLVLIEGAPGTMKSSLAFSILLHNAARAGLHCLYLSLEERASSLFRQMASLGLKLDVLKGSLIVLDPRTAADLLGEKPDWIDALQRGIRSIKGQRGLDVIVIDSLEALEVLAKFKDRRREMYRLFEWLRDLGVTSFVVTERPDWLIGGHVLQGRWDEDFLADGVIHVRIHMVSDLEAQRRLRVVKMRGAKHETGYMALILDDGGFRVTRAISP